MLDTRSRAFVWMCMHVCIIGVWRQNSLHMQSCLYMQQQQRLVRAEAAHKYGNRCVFQAFAATLWLLKSLFIFFLFRSHLNCCTPQKHRTGWPGHQVRWSWNPRTLRIRANSALSHKDPPSAWGLQLKLHDVPLKAKVTGLWLSHMFLQGVIHYFERGWLQDV